MIKICAAGDQERLAEYLKEEPYGRAIAAAIEKYGFEKNFQTVYAGVKKTDGEEEITGVFLFLNRALILFSRENQVEIDFLEEIFGIQQPDLVAGRMDNVNIVSWLLTDYERKDRMQYPEPRISGENGEDLFGENAGFAGEWSLLVSPQLQTGGTV